MDIHFDRAACEIAITRCFCTQWSRDPLYRGAYSFLAAGSSGEDRLRLQRAVSDRLFIAGEHTSVEYPATLHGAFSSGLRAADAILKSSACSPGARIVVVGAGFAGLSAAKKLQDCGMRVAVLEAGDDIGGRAKSSRALGGGGEVHLGGSWLHGTEGHFLNSEPFKVEREQWEWSLETAVLSEDGKVASFIDTSRLKEAYDAVEQAICTRAASATENQCLADVFHECLQSSKLQGVEAHVLQCLLTTDFEQSYACTLQTLSLRHCREEYHLPSPAQSSAEDFIITSPLSNILLTLKEGLDIRTSVAVRSVTCSSSNVVVASDSGDYDADFAVVTVPLGVLKAGAIDFSPPLPADVNDRWSSSCCVLSLNDTFMQHPKIGLRCSVHKSAHHYEFARLLHCSVYVPPAGVRCIYESVLGAAAHVPRSTTPPLPQAKRISLFGFLLTSGSLP
jgi:monoamine oxidase